MDQTPPQFRSLLELAMPTNNFLFRLLYSVSEWRHHNSRDRIASREIRFCSPQQVSCWEQSCFWKSSQKWICKLWKDLQKKNMKLKNRNITLACDIGEKKILGPFSCYRVVIWIFSISVSQFACIWFKKRSWKTRSMYNNDVDKTVFLIRQCDITSLFSMTSNVQIIWT
jgi:hypothetical protein